MTGNTYIDAMAYAGFGVYATAIFGPPLWMLVDWLRSKTARHAATDRKEPQWESASMTTAPRQD